MSSAMVLQNMDTKGRSEFSFTWSLHNFSYCNFDKIQNDYIGSPDFEIQFLKDKKWWLKLYPLGNGVEGRGFISCYVSSDHKTKSDFQFTLSILNPNGQIQEGPVTNFEGADDEDPEPGCHKLISLEELKGPDGYLANDTLIVRLHAWKTDSDNPTSMRSYAHSKVKASKLDYTWVLNDFAVSKQTFKFKSDHKTTITDFFSDNLFPIIKISVSDENRLGLDKDAIYFGVKMKNTRKHYFWVCRIHVIGADGKVVQSAYGEHRFKANLSDTEHWYFPIISKYKLCSNPNLYLPRKTLTLKCEIGYSTRTKLNTFKFQTTDYLERKRVTADQAEDDQKLWTDKVMRQSSKDDRKFSDFVIRTPDETFPVHRLILSAQSEVFAAMFERDMKEKKSGEVEINDLDNDTISKMLQFLYTARISDMDYSSAKKLYYAADKYRIVALQNRCSGYLLQSLSTSNVCDVFYLADEHQDQVLKSYARDFIEVHAQDILNSESWKQLVETNMQLTHETLQWFFCKSKGIVL